MWLSLTDMLALRFVAGTTITTGEYEKARDTFAWALAFWTEDMELYPYVLALYVCQVCTWLENEISVSLLCLTNELVVK